MFFLAKHNKYTQIEQKEQNIRTLLKATQIMILANVPTVVVIFV